MTLTVTQGPQGPFPIEELFACAMHFVDVQDYCNAASVCTLWKQFTDTLAENHAVWEVFFASKGIPMVSQEAGPRNYRYDFRVLYPVTTVSGEAIRQTLGDPIGKIPCIRAEIFNNLSQPDPFDPTKFQNETFELIVEFPFVERVLGTSTSPWALIDGDLVDAAPSDTAEEDIAAQTPTRIPLSLSNRIKLCKHPLMGQKHMPVFYFVNTDVVQQCDYCPIRVNVYYQRKKIVDGTRNLSYPEQKAFVEEKGVPVMPLGPRVLSNAVQIIKLGTCPDDRNSYARTSSPVSFGGNVYQSDVGGFAPRGGVRVYHHHHYVHDSIGVVVGGPAEVPSALGPLETCHLKS